MSSLLPNDEMLRLKLDNIAKFYRLSFEDFLSPDRNKMSKKGDFEYNIAGWINSGKSLDLFKNAGAKEVVFYTPDEQFKTVESYFDRYGRNPQALGKILTRLWIVDMLRKPK